MDERHAAWPIVQASSGILIVPIMILASSLSFTDCGLWCYNAHIGIELTVVLYFQRKMMTALILSCRTDTPSRVIDEVCVALGLNDSAATNFIPDIWPSIRQCAQDAIARTSP